MEFTLTPWAKINLRVVQILDPRPKKLRNTPTASAKNRDFLCHAKVHEI